MAIQVRLRREGHFSMAAHRVNESVAGIGLDLRGDENTSHV